MGWIADARQELYEGSKTYFIVLEADLCFFSNEINAGIQYAGIEQMDVFEKPQTGRAMDFGNIELYPCHVVILKINEFALSQSVVEVCVSVGVAVALRAAGIGVKFIVFFHTIFRQYAEYHFATLATKNFICQMD